MGLENDQDSVKQVLIYFTFLSFDAIASDSAPPTVISYIDFAVMLATANKWISSFILLACLFLLNA